MQREPFSCLSWPHIKVSTQASSVNDPCTDQCSEVDPVCEHFLPKNFRPWQNRFATLNLFNLSTAADIFLFLGENIWRRKIYRDEIFMARMRAPSHLPLFSTVFPMTSLHKNLISFSQETICIGSPTYFPFYLNIDQRKEWKQCLVNSVGQTQDFHSIKCNSIAQCHNSRPKSLGKGSKRGKDQIKSIFSAFSHWKWLPK